MTYIRTENRRVVRAVLVPVTPSTLHEVLVTLDPEIEPTLAGILTQLDSSSLLPLAISAHHTRYDNLREDSKCSDMNDLHLRYILLQIQARLDAGNELHSIGICAQAKGKDTETYLAVWTRSTVRPAASYDLSRRYGNVFFFSAWDRWLVCILDI